MAILEPRITMWPLYLTFMDKTSAIVIVDRAGTNAPATAGSIRLWSMYPREENHYHHENHRRQSRWWQRSLSENTDVNHLSFDGCSSTAWLIEWKPIFKTNRVEELGINHLTIIGQNKQKKVGE